MKLTSASSKRPVRWMPALTNWSNDAGYVHIFHVTLLALARAQMHEPDDIARGAPIECGKLLSSFCKIP